MTTNQDQSRSANVRRPGVKRGGAFADPRLLRRGGVFAVVLMILLDCGAVMAGAGPTADLWRARPSVSLQSLFEEDTLVQLDGLVGRWSLVRSKRYQKTLEVERLWGRSYRLVTHTLWTDTQTKPVVSPPLHACVYRLGAQYVIELNPERVDWYLSPYAYWLLRFERGRLRICDLSQELSEAVRAGKILAMARSGEDVGIPAVIDGSPAVIRAFLEAGVRNGILGRFWESYARKP